MSLRPLFSSAPRIKIRANGQLIGYAIGFSVNVSVDVQPVYVIGEYAPVALEPNLYRPVTGSMQIVRLRNLAEGVASTGGGKFVKNAAGKVVPPTDPSAIANNSPLDQKALFKHLEPQTILFSQTFDIDLYMKVPTSETADGVLTTLTTTEALWMTIKDCRIVSRNTNISMGQLVNEPLNFQGLLVSPTDETAAFSLDSSVKQA